jgi:hypothetical protein
MLECQLKALVVPTSRASIMEAAASAHGAPHWWSARPRRAGAARRAQALRAHGRAVGHLLRAVEALEAHRGGTPTRLAFALAEALRAPRHADQAPPSPPVDLRVVRPEAQAETEKQSWEHRDVAARDVVMASVWEASAQQGASVLQGVAAPHEAHGATEVCAAAVAPAPHPLAPTETLRQASDRWRWNSGATPFTPAAQAAVTMDVDFHSAPGAAANTAAEPAAAAAGGDSGGGLGVSGRQQSEVQASLVPEPSLQVGDRVEIHGLLGSPELNGRTGRIASFVKETSRVEVRLEGDVTTKGVRATNLRKVVDACADVCSAEWWTRALSAYPR